MIRETYLTPLYDYLLGSHSDRLTSAERFEIFAQADGFGDTRQGEQREWLAEYVLHGYDWSHVRDATDPAIKRAGILLQETLRAKRPTADDLRAIVAARRAA